MIGRLRGVLAEVSDEEALIDVGGVGYVVRCGTRTLSRFPALGDEVLLHVEHQFNAETGPRLYGFLVRDERRAFAALQTVQGVGPKAALGVLDVLSPGELAQAVGGAAVLAWLIAGVVVIVLALAHAELGAMYPVSGGTARFPHFAFGSVAGIGFGFFSYVQAVTIAPIECFAFMQYASYYWPSLYNAKTHNVTGTGFIFTIVLMAVFVAVNFLAIRAFARVNSTITWWKVAIPVLAIIVLLFKFHGGNFTAGGQGFMPGGAHALFAALPAAGIVFAYSGFEQADQLAGEI